LGRLKLCHPTKSILQHRALLTQRCRELCLHHHKVLDTHRFRLQQYAVQLGSLSPLACLARGYSITRRATDGVLIRSWKEVKEGEDVRIGLAEGTLKCTVRRAEEKDDLSGHHPS
jgi:exodeoxyribonuclease VII large subunit